MFKPTVNKFILNNNKLQSLIT